MWNTVLVNINNLEFFADENNSKFISLYFKLNEKLCQHAGSNYLMFFDQNFQNIIQLQLNSQLLLITKQSQDWLIQMNNFLYIYLLLINKLKLELIIILVINISFFLEAVGIE